MKEFKKVKKFTEDETWNFACQIQEVLEFSLKKGQIYATLNGEEFKTRVYPKKFVKKYTKGLDFSKCYIEGWINSDEDYLEELAEIYDSTCWRLTDEESGIVAFQYFLENNIDKFQDFESILKLVKRNMKEILENEMYSDLQCKLDFDREFVYFGGKCRD